MDERIPRSRPRAPMHPYTHRAMARRTAGYAAILLAGASLAAMLAPGRDATAEGKRIGAPAAAPTAGYATLALNFRPLQIAQANELVPGKYVNNETNVAASIFEGSLKSHLAEGCRGVANAIEALENLQDLARRLPTFEKGAPAPAGARRDGVYADGQARGHDGDLVRKAIRDGDYGNKIAVLVRKCRPQVHYRGLAAAAVKACNEDDYFQAIAELRTEAQQLEQEANQRASEGKIEDARALDAAAKAAKAEADKLAREKDAAFKNCPKPRAAAAPPPSGPRTTVPPPSDRTAPPPGAPQRPVGLPFTPGFVLEPWVAVTVRFNDAEGAYSSDGGQAPGTGKGDKTQGNVCGGAEFRMPFFDFAAIAGMQGIEYLAVGTTEAGLRFGYCELGSGEKVAFSEIRHGADGAVTLTERERTEIMLLFMVQQNLYIDVARLFGQDRIGSRDGQYAAADLAQAPGMRARNWWPFAVYFGVGPSFVRTTISMTSNQAPGGGVFEAASQRRWDTGVSFVVGGKTALCRDCAFGSPVMFGIEGQWTRLPARNIAVTSSTFGFTESGRVSGRSVSRLTFKVSVPFGIGR